MIFLFKAYLKYNKMKTKKHIDLIFSYFQEKMFLNKSCISCYTKTYNII